MKIEVPDEARQTLLGWLRKSSCERRRVRRASIVLALGEGKKVSQVAREQGIDENRVRLWRSRFVQGGVEALEADAPCPGRPHTIPAERRQAVLTLTRMTTPDDATQWSVRTISKVAEVSPASVQRIWADAGLKPHPVKTFKLSTDPRFEETLVDVALVKLSNALKSGANIRHVWYRMYVECDAGQRQAQYLTLSKSSSVARWLRLS
jgi:transposase